MKYTLFVFNCESPKGMIEQEMISTSEENARRESIYVLNSLHNFHPRKLTLLRSEPWEPPTLAFD
jgi:hypothetical protein